ncbi:hypothetical protein PLICRDRAFT_123342 [Plicaturopsis crispa FD-325 SS-3]|nr:hypothetical protein PLICRDRAFT_123342 [Plicaturopsis crispa FD-325 SS-3]
MSHSMRYSPPRFPAGGPWAFDDSNAGASSSTWTGSDFLFDDSLLNASPMDTRNNVHLASYGDSSFDNYTNPYGGAGDFYDPLFDLTSTFDGFSGTADNMNGNIDPYLLGSNVPYISNSRNASPRGTPSMRQVALANSRHGTPRSSPLGKTSTLPPQTGYSAGYGGGASPGSQASHQLPSISTHHRSSTSYAQAPEPSAKSSKPSQFIYMHSKGDKLERLRNTPPSLATQLPTGRASPQDYYGKASPSSSVTSSNTSDEPRNYLFMTPDTLPPKPKRNAALKKPVPLACLFCRHRKIACGRPDGISQGPCTNCTKRGTPCEFPKESKRGLYRRKQA